MPKPKKSLGQNFLQDMKVLDKIIASANLNTTDNILEVGPGKGALTKELLKNAKKIIAIEKDDALALELISHWNLSAEGSSENDKIKIINADILAINLPELLQQNNFLNYKVIANIPYYITSPIIRLFLETTYSPTEMILMVQKEVAQRICAKAGKLSILALSVQYYAKTELLFAVPASAFSPVPKVDSAIIRIKLNAIQKSRTTKQTAKDKIKTKKFFRIVKAGFSAKRKTLINNLSASLNLEKSLVEEKLKQLGVSKNIRAQELCLEDWKKLAELI